ncbi:MAG: hypothetical protein IJX53_09040 [Clostridia bacterium]|nr:hypothetical protein [Clostridia bacterium]
MKFMRTAATLLLCLCLLPGCGKDELPEGVELPETHAGAINPDGVSSIHFIHYDEAGTADVDLTLDSASPFVPLVATVYDKAAETDKTGERTKVFDVTMTMDNGDVIALAIYSDMTMENGSAVLTGKDMHDFLFSFLPIPNAEVEKGIETVA